MGGQGSRHPAVGCAVDSNEGFGRRFARPAVDGRRLAIWGAGSKGVTFLNAIPCGREIDAVIDINLRKHGRFVPGTAQEVRGPEALEGRDLDTVLVLNPLSEDEIRASLSDRGVRAEVLVV